MALYIPDGNSCSIDLLTKAHNFQIIGLFLATATFVAGLAADVTLSRRIFLVKNALSFCSAPLELVISILYWSLRVVSSVISVSYSRCVLFKFLIASKRIDHLNIYSLSLYLIILTYLDRRKPRAARMGRAQPVGRLGLPRSTCHRVDGGLALPLATLDAGRSAGVWDQRSHCTGVLVLGGAVLCA